MATFVANTVLTTGQTLGTGETGIVTQNGGVAITDFTDAVRVTGTNSVLIVDGGIYAKNSGVNVRTEASLDMLIGAQGSILGGNNAIVGNNNQTIITNFGSVAGDRGINIGGTFSGSTSRASLTLENAGTISGTSSGILVGDIMDLQVVNSGLITSSDTAIDLTFLSSSSTVDILNTGDITGGSMAFQGVGTDDMFRNQGTINGDMNFEGGNDVYNGRFGTVFGTIDGGDGDDMIKGGSEDNMLLGGAGKDMLFGYGGDDTIDGGNGGDVLRGGAGDDELIGGGRSDVLVGGRGDDTLQGDSGSDTFVFRRTDNGNDIVVDYEDGSDLIDLSAFDIQNFNQLNNQLGAVSNGPGGVVIDLTAAGGSGSVKIEGIVVGDLSGADFIF